jgi:CheY-like chemotaxis protein
MPGMTGLDVARRLRADPPTRNVPIVFVSAYVSEEETRRSVGAAYSAFVRRRSDAFVSKPCLPEVLLAEVKRVLAS